MEFGRDFISGFFVLWILITGTEVVMGLEPCNFPAIYNFGDSNSDTGGISAAFMPNPPPYGETFFGKQSGRSCDGRLVIDFIAEHLKLRYLHAYLDSIESNFRHGANFATGGSTIRPQNETIFEAGISPFSLNVQLWHFEQFKARTIDLQNEVKNGSYRRDLPIPSDFSKALYTFDIGQNDLSAGFRKMSVSQLQASIPDIIDKFSLAIQKLYEQGGRTFWVHNTGPLGCLPVSSLYLYNPSPSLFDQYGCLKAQNEMAMEFNKQLKNRVIELRTELPLAAISYVDVYAAKYGLISNAKKQGFVDPLKICCGKHEGYTNVWCGAKQIINGTEVYGASCTSPSSYIIWDGVHFSQAANRWITNQILNGSLSDPPVPLINSCYKHANV